MSAGIWTPVVLLKKLVAKLLHIKGIVQSKIKRLSSFTHPRFIPNVYGISFSMKIERRSSEECSRCSLPQ